MCVICGHCKRDKKFGGTDLDIDCSPDGVRITFRRVGDRVRVTVENPALGDHPNFMTSAENDVALAAAELLNGMLERRSSR